VKLRRCCACPTYFADVSGGPITYPGVQVRIVGAARSVADRRRYQTLRRDYRAGTTHVRGVPLEIPQGSGDRPLMGGAHLLDGRRRAQGVEQAHRLRDREGAVEGGNPDPGVAGIEGRSVGRIHPASSIDRPAGSTVRSASPRVPAKPPHQRPPDLNSGKSNKIWGRSSFQREHFPQ